MCIRDSLQGVSWQVNYQGKACHSAYCESEILIIYQDESLQKANAVPRRSCELAEDDKRKLERLNLSPSSWHDDASIMAARYALDERITMVKIERGKSGEQLCKSKVLQLIQGMMKASTKPARK